MNELTCNRHFWQLKEFTLMWIKKITMYEKGEVVCYWSQFLLYDRTIQHLYYRLIKISESDQCF